jgi:hypothetical protein
LKILITGGFSDLFTLLGFTAHKCFIRTPKSYYRKSDIGVFLDSTAEKTAALIFFFNGWDNFNDPTVAVIHDFSIRLQKKRRH